MRVLYVPLDMSPAERAAWTWLTAQPDIASVRANAAEAARMARLTRADVVWIDAAFPIGIVPPGLAELAASDAPGWLLTNGAVFLPYRLGLEPAAPDVVIDRPWRDAEDELFFFDTFAETPRLRGHAAFRRHGLFAGLGSGAYTWWPSENETYRGIMHDRSNGPTNARVIAVERGFIHINERRATIWSYQAPRRILCIGAYLPFDASDTIFTPIRERLTRNALAWPGAADLESDLHWFAGTPATRKIEPDDHPASHHTAVTHERLPLELASLRASVRAGTPFTLAGRRALVAGTIGGPREVWLHPFRAMKLGGHSGSETSATITSLGVEQDRAREDQIAVERTAVLHERAAVVLEWNTAPLSFDWQTDLRLMWPYGAGVLGVLEWHATHRSLLVRSSHTHEGVLFQASHDVHWSVADETSGGAPALRCGFTSDHPAAPLRLVVSALEPDEPPLPDVRLPRANVEPARTSPRQGVHRPPYPAIENEIDADDALRARAARLRRMTSERLRVDAPEPDIGNAFEWAKVRLDSYLVDTPGIGRSLVAGYWTSRPGWNEARPGYAWYFGRDAAWTALACLAVGEFDAVRDTIDFLGNHQDLSGKILHECTTSGSVHYDAADSTPLYLLLVARYLAWTGDAAFVREQLPRVRAALDFCVSTDTDGDGLIENTRVGHGWIEFGRLGGGKVTYYNAGIWTAALRELGTSFEDIGEHSLAHSVRDRARTARTAIERLFYSSARRAYALKAWNPSPDESLDEPEASAVDFATVRLGDLLWARDFTPTATHAVPLLLGVADPERARSWLDRVATPDFSAEWGVRMVPRSEPGFDPGSYHGGAVWPLYTGWTAWAEYMAGRAEAGFRHCLANLALAFENEPGAWDEVLHGTERRAIGVCPDQAWSTAMAVCPFVYGLLGFEPDAPRGRLRLRPQIPAQWDRLDVRNLRIGDAVVSLRYRRGGSTHSFILDQDSGAVPLRVIFEPALPVRSIDAVRIDGIEARLDARPFGDRLSVSAQVMLDHSRTIELMANP